MRRLSSFTIGICASDRSEKFPQIFNSIKNEFDDPLHDFELKSIIVVASGCTSNVISWLRPIASQDPRLKLLTEPRRRGKAEAINKILQLAEGEFVVLINSDAIPKRGSIKKLIEVAMNHPKVGTVSAAPTFEPPGGIISRVLELMWSAHNDSAIKLNHFNLSNHACDELMLLRNGLVKRIPEDVINDGAYIGGIVYTKGYSVKFSTEAQVIIDVPKRVFYLIQQRRRIIFGHLMVWRRVGSPPRTIESLLIFRPYTGLRILVDFFSRRPVLIFCAPIAVVIELLAATSAFFDRLTSSDKHKIWRRYPGSG